MTTPNHCQCVSAEIKVKYPPSHQRTLTPYCFPCRRYLMYLHVYLKLGKKKKPGLTETKQTSSRIDRERRDKKTSENLFQILADKKQKVATKDTQGGI